MSAHRIDTKRLRKIVEARESTDEHERRRLPDELGAAISRVVLIIRCIFFRDETRVERLMTAKELAALVRLSEKTVYRDASAGRIPCVRIGRRVLFDKDALDTYRMMQVRGTPQARDSGSI